MALGRNASAHTGLHELRIGAGQRLTAQSRVVEGGEWVAGPNPTHPAAGRCRESRCAVALVRPRLPPAPALPAACRTPRSRPRRPAAGPPAGTPAGAVLVSRIAAAGPPMLAPVSPMIVSHSVCHCARFVEDRLCCLCCARFASPSGVVNQRTGKTERESETVRASWLTPSTRSPSGPRNPWEGLRQPRKNEAQDRRVNSGSEPAQLLKCRLRAPR